MQRLATVLLMLVAASGAKAEETGNSRWPDPRARLSPPATVGPATFPKRRVYVDAGHGAEGNTGTRSVMCEDEESITLRISTSLAEQLRRTGLFEVRISRDPDNRVSYGTRLKEAQDWGADVFLSIHADSRNEGIPWTPGLGLTCLRQDGAPGFSILFSQEGDQETVRRRERVASAIARRMSETGFLAYDGADYVGLYAQHSEPGVFLDRRGLMVLRRPRMPSVIVETYHAWDAREDARWHQPETMSAFARSVAAALVESLNEKTR